MDKQIRKLTFGKYKGLPILLVIAEHIGYIMWCLENLHWFKLNDDEQKFYDWQAIAIKKYCKRMIFPVETMYKHVKDQDALNRLETPYQFIGDDPYMPKTELTSLFCEAGVIRKTDSTPIPNHDSNSRPWYRGLQNTMMKDIEMMSDEEIAEMEDYGITPPMPPMY